VGNDPSGVDYDSSRGEVFSANNADDTVSVISAGPATSSTVPEFPDAALAFVALSVVASVAFFSRVLYKKR